MTNQAMPPKPSGSGLAPNVASLLCYACPCTLVTGIIFLIIERENRPVKFHAWQATMLGIAIFVIYIALWILQAALAFSLGPLAVVMGLVSFIVNIGALILWIVCMVKAYRGEIFKLPIIGDMAEKQLGA